MCARRPGPTSPCRRPGGGLARGLAALATLVTLCLGAAGCEKPEAGTGPWEIQSPDGRLVLTIDLQPDPASGLGDPGEARLSYSLTRDGQTLLGPSPLGIETDAGSFVYGLRLVSAERREVSDQYLMPTGKRRERQVEGQELTLTLANEAGGEVAVIFRAHDDGIAFRYRLLGAGDVTVLGEASGFRVPENGTGFLAPFDFASLYFFATYEQLPEWMPVGTDTVATGWAYPALFEVPEAGAWLLITEADLTADYCGTRLDPEPDGGLYRVRLPFRFEGLHDNPLEPRATRPFETPWRVVMAGSLSTVVESTLVDDLSRPSAVADTAWIRPGRVAWSWFTQDTGDATLQREYVAFAAMMGWEYVLIDARWDQWPNVESVIPALAATADASGVGLVLWYNSGGEHTIIEATPRDRMVDRAVRRQEMTQLQQWGIAGIKVDFFESDKQARIQQYLGILQDAADYELLVNFHGATLPRGWQRTYPHLMSHEAVRGAEYFRVTGTVARPDADSHLFNVFARNPVGSMDYTPVVFADALRESSLSYAHSLAQAVLFESGLQHFAGRADVNPDAGYRAVFDDYPFVGELLATVPVAWDDTRLVDGDPRTHVVLARRRGDHWWLAGLTGNDEPLVGAVPLDFLGTGDYDLRLVTRDDAPQTLKHTVQTVTAGDTLDLSLDPRDGFIAHLIPTR